MKLFSKQIFIFILLCALFCISILQCGDRDTYESFMSNGENVYFQGGNFTMTFPSGWHVFVSDENQEVSASSVSSKSVHVSVSYDDRNYPVTVIEAMEEDQVSIDSFIIENPGIDSVLGELQISMPSFIVSTDSQLTEVGGFMALRIVTRVVPYGSDWELTSLKYRFIIGTWDYSIYCSSATSEFSNYLETFEKICSSFKRGFAW